MSSELYKRINYTQDIGLLKNKNIYEYDIVKANISVLLNRGQISSSLYDFLFKQPNLTRQIFVGNMERKNRQLIKEKAQGIEDAKRYLFESNNIQDYEILSIKNDAVFVTRELKYLEYNNAKFTLRNRYSLFVRVMRLQLFYLDRIGDNEVLHIKGIKDSILESHKDYMLDFVKELFFTFETEGVEETLVLLRTFYYNYMNRKLPVGYYKDLYSGKYPLITNSLVFSYSSTAPSDDILPIIDIVNNGVFLRELSKVFYVEYLRTK